jgi:CBS domain containing-hemolysin-like protein
VDTRYVSLLGPRQQPHEPAVAPVAWPIAKLLDYTLGKNETHTYKKAELKSFLQFHRTGQEPLRDDEISILNGVLELNTKKVERIMTSMRVSGVLVLDPADGLEILRCTGYGHTEF